MTVDQVSDATNIPRDAIAAAADALGRRVRTRRRHRRTGHRGRPATARRSLVAALSGERPGRRPAARRRPATPPLVSRDDPAVLAAAFGRSLDALVAATGLRSELGEFGTTDVLPTMVIGLGGGDTAASFGLVLDAEGHDEPAAEPTSQSTPSAADFQPAPLTARRCGGHTVEQPAHAPARRRDERHGRARSHDDADPRPALATAGDGRRDRPRRRRADRRARQRAAASRAARSW